MVANSRVNKGFLSEDQRTRHQFITAKGTGITDGYLQAKLPDSKVKHHLFVYFGKIHILNKYLVLLFEGGKEIGEAELRRS